MVLSPLSVEEAALLGSAFRYAPPSCVSKSQQEKLHLSRFLGEGSQNPLLRVRHDLPLQLSWVLFLDNIHTTLTKGQKKQTDAPLVLNGHKRHNNHRLGYFDVAADGQWASSHERIYTK
jgi:hypothetical protein